MSGYRKILVAVDGSDAGTNALRQAYRVSPVDSSWVTVLTAFPRLVDEEALGVISRDQFTAVARREAEQILADASRLAAAESLPLSATLAIEGAPFEAIVEVAQQGRFDLIVMGRRGRSRLERALMGSVTARVIGYAPTDVLVVPRDASLAWTRILVPFDGSRHGRAALETAAALARDRGAALDVLCVADTAGDFHLGETPGNLRELLAAHTRRAVEEAKALVRERGVTAEIFSAEGRAHEVIAAFARDREATLLAMGSHGRTGLRRLLMGSVTEQVIGAVSVPVLIPRL